MVYVILQIVSRALETQPEMRAASEQGLFQVILDFPFEMREEQSFLFP